MARPRSVLLILMLVVVVGGIALVTYEGVIVVAPTVAMFRDLWSALYHGR